MPELSEFASQARVSTAELSKVSEVAVLDSNSNVFQTLLQKISTKWSAQLKLKDADVRVRKQRVYLPHALDSTHRYQLSTAFPHFDLRFISTSVASAAYARSVSTIVSEQLFSYARTDARDVILYGYELRPSIMRNRVWAHMCMSGADMKAQSVYRSEDRELECMWASLSKRGKHCPQALTNYMVGSFSPVCPDVNGCSVKAPVILAMLDRVDTNYRQLATFMVKRAASVMYFAIPAGKAMEYCTDGELPQLEAKVIARDGVITLLWPDDVDFQRSYTHSNYIELIARTKVVMYGKTFVKEFVSNLLGYAVYKITANDGVFDDQLPDYKSWIDPAYKSKYMVYAPVLAENGVVSNHTSWSIQHFPVDMSLIDNVFDMAHTNDDKRIDQIILHRISSMAQNFVSSGQIARRSHPMSLDAFENAARAIYCRVFMEKYRAGSAVSLYAPTARFAADMAKGGFSSAFKQYASSVSSSIASAFDFLAKPLASYHSMVSFEDYGLLPEISPCCGFVEYSDQASGNPMFKGWLVDTGNPYVGFTPILPGLSHYAKIDFNSVYGAAPVEQQPQEVATSRGFLKQLTGFTATIQHHIVDFHDPELVVGEIDNKFPDLLSDDFADDVDETQLEPRAVVQTQASGDTGWDRGRECPLYYRSTEEIFDPQVYDASADYIVSKVCGEHASGPGFQVPYVFNAYLAPQADIPYVQGFKSMVPVSDAKNAISLLFPESQTMRLDYLEAERAYGDFEITVRSIRTKVDMSKLEVLKPESFFLPAIRGHLAPHIHDNLPNAIQTVAKRNADTPYQVDPLDHQELWERSWRAMLKLYYVPEAEYFLDNSPLIEPDEANVREWLAKQDPLKIKKLLSQSDYSFSSMEANTTSMQFMLKAKLKPEMDASYESALKMPQSIQFDQTGRSVAALTPIIRQKVKREQFLLKPNVLVMQRKSFDNIHNFLNQFDHRPNSKGKRYYIEIDETMFDKAQVRELAEMYLKKCEKFGIPARFLDFIKEKMYKRLVSSMKSGVAIELEDQNPSGAAFTLDRNNDVSEISLAIVLEKIADQIEFIMFMGDDVTVAVRGDVNVSSWERDMSRMFNLTSKVNVHEHGYFCSFDIVHLPDGKSTITRDIVKALIQLMDLSIKDRDILEERWISYKDSMRNIGNGYVQDYLIQHLTPRWSAMLQKEVSSDAIRCAISVASTIAVDYNEYQKFFPNVKIQKFY